MALTEYQYSVFTEMGIPVWTKRQSKSTQDIASTETIPADTLQTQEQKIPDDVQVVLVVEATALNAVERRLLTSILKSVGLDNRRQYIIASSEVVRLSPDELNSKIILTMMKSEQRLPEGIDAVQLPSLEAMIRQPSLKAVAWQQLKTHGNALN